MRFKQWNMPVRYTYQTLHFIFIVNTEHIVKLKYFTFNWIDADQILKEEHVIVVTMDISIFHIVNHAIVVLKEQHLKFAINKMKHVSVKKMFKELIVIDALMEHIIYKNQIQKVAQNVFALVKQLDVNALIYVHSM